jgi:hypothetical protein
MTPAVTAVALGTFGVCGSQVMPPDARLPAARLPDVRTNVSAETLHAIASGVSAETFDAIAP